MQEAFKPYETQNQKETQTNSLTSYMRYTQAIVDAILKHKEKPRQSLQNKNITDTIQTLQNNIDLALHSLKEDIYKLSLYIQSMPPEVHQKLSSIFKQHLPPIEK